MNLISADDDLFNLYFQKKTSATGLVNMALYPVIFGWRVRGWLSTGHCCHIDWCAGGEQGEAEKLYSMLYNILSSREEDEHAFDNLPEASRKKPYYYDSYFVAAVARNLVAPFELLKLPPLDELRKLIPFH